jgi:hypothetical protein
LESGSKSNAKQLIKKAGEIREQEHRIKPSLRLKTREEIFKFIHDSGLVSALGGNELPSFISAILGKPWKPSGKGFTGWMDWWSVKISGQPVARVSREVESRDDILACRLFRRTKTLVSDKVWPTLNPIVKHHQELVQKGRLLSHLERRLLETIDAEGSIRTDRLREKLKLKTKENNSKFHRSLSNLESYALIVGFEDPYPESHMHANIWRTWNTRTGKRASREVLSYPEALSKLLEKTIDASVLAREDQVGKWFRWTADMSAVKEGLLGSGTILKAGPYLVSSRICPI